MDGGVATEKNCKQCGKSFKAKTEWQKFCTTDCHDSYWNKIRKIAKDLAERGIV